MESQYIERHIVTGCIVSTRYLQQMRPALDVDLLEVDVARILVGWCLEYYDKYNKAPNKDIEGLYYKKLRAGLDKDLAQEIEEDILPDLSEEYEREGFNVDFLLDQSRAYFNEKNLVRHSESIQDLVDRGELSEAEARAHAYKPLAPEANESIDLSNPASLERVKQAFTEAAKPLIEYPGALGGMVNSHLVRGGFVSLLAPEKRGKSFWLLDLARRAVRQRMKVAFFQAGDMSESQQIRRLGIQLAKKSDLEEYCGKMYEPVKDCVHNQMDTCTLSIRECDHGFDADYSEEQLKLLTFEQLVELHKQHPEYKACHNCKQYQTSKWGVPWVKKVDVGAPLEPTEVVQLFQDYFINKKRSMRISTHANSTLSVPLIDSILDQWYREGFIPDVIIIDYADLLIGTTKEYRHLQDEIWRALRRMSKQRHSLIVTATQADAQSYKKDLMDLTNFSEDKRKYAHATAIFGLNQDTNGREKRIGITRVNTLVAREGEFNVRDVVHVLQNLKRGQPVLTSYL